VCFRNSDPHSQKWSLRTLIPGAVPSLRVSLYQRNADSGRSNISIWELS
jgi:hypothetical protein